MRLRQAQNSINLVLAATVLAAAGLLLASCDSSKQQQQPPKRGSSDNNNDADAGDNTPGLDSSADGANVFSLWCERAAEIAPVKRELKRLHAAFCAGSKPTSLLTSQLAKIAYTGNGDPRFKLLDEFQHSKSEKTTTGYIGVGIKLPISIEEHFGKVGPRGGDKDALKDLAEAQGAKGDPTILKRYNKDGKYHVRGWKIHNKNTKDLVITKIITETESRSDQFMLEESKAYAYTEITLKSIQGIKEFSMLTAGVEIDGQSYLLTQAYIIADNKGIPSVAEDEIKKTAKGIITAMYEAATEAQ